MGFTDNEGKPGNFAEQYNMRRETHLTSLQQKEEEMRQKFVIRVKEKEAELKEAEKEVHSIFYVKLNDQNDFTKKSLLGLCELSRTYREEF